ncbi:MAG TPA: DUF3048 domain-containing protein [Candidatus Woesebacteria bacterium]|nr:DUF3048 domain-containing protein [Candidatus Woesebacteria bacterium]
MPSAKQFPVKTIIALVATFLASGGLAYAVVPPSGGVLISPKTETVSESSISSSGFSQFANEPKTEACPLNGKLYSKSEKTLWETRRPILAMIENHVDSRPQSGLSYADIIYEAVAEGGITRFMGVFYCGAQGDTAKIAPVRSARIYFVNIAAEYNTPIYLHVGGGNCSRDEASGQCTSNKKAWAIEELTKLGWRKPGGNDFDTTGDIGMPVLGRDYNRLGTDKVVATEHTMVGYLSAAWKEAAERGFTAKMSNDTPWLSSFTSWKNASSVTTSGSSAINVKFGFWDNQPDFDVEWKYDTTSKTYLRYEGGSSHVDLENNRQLSAANVVVQFVKEEGPLDEHKHMFYYVTGNGTGYIFRNGQAEEITWKKATQTSRTLFYDKSGKEITFVAGNIWVELLPIGNKVEYN